MIIRCSTTKSLNLLFKMLILLTKIYILFGKRLKIIFLSITHFSMLRFLRVVNHFRFSSLNFEKTSSSLIGSNTDSKRVIFSRYGLGVRSY